MFDALYRRRLERDFEKWVDEGLVDRTSADTIVARLPRTDLRERFPQLIAMLGAILLGFAAIAFVAANWTELSKLTRLIILFATMWAAYAAAWWLQRKDHERMSDAAVMVGAAMFGANIMLIAQIYHIERHYPDGVLVWGLGALLAAWLTASRGALALSIMLFGFWTWYETFEFGPKVHWQFLLPWAVAAWAVWQEKWRLGGHLALWAFGVWAIITVFAFHEIFDWPPVGAVTMLAALALAVFTLGRWIAGPTKRGLATDFGFAGARYGLFFHLVLLFILQAVLKEEGDRIWQAIVMAGPQTATILWLAALGALTAIALVAAFAARGRAMFSGRDIAILALVAVAPALLAAVALNELAAQWMFATVYLIYCIWCMGHGQHAGDTVAANLGFFGFGAELLYVYFVTFGTLIDTALFFLIGGVVLIAVAIFLVRLHRRMAAQEAPEPAEDEA